MRCNGWSNADTEKLAALYRAALIERDLKPKNRFGQPAPIDFDSIGVALGRTASAIMSEVSRAGIHRADAKLRTCLGPSCRGERKFWSESVGNRMCGRCLGWNAEAA